MFFLFVLASSDIPDLPSPRLPPPPVTDIVLQILWARRPEMMQGQGSGGSFPESSFVRLPDGGSAGALSAIPQWLRLWKPQALSVASESCVCVNSSRHWGKKEKKRDHAKSLLVVAVVLSDGDKIGDERVKRATCSHGWQVSWNSHSGWKLVGLIRWWIAPEPFTCSCVSWLLVCRSYIDFFALPKLFPKNRPTLNEMLPRNFRYESRSPGPVVLWEDANASKTPHNILNLKNNAKIQKSLAKNKMQWCFFLSQSAT